MVYMATPQEQYEKLQADPEYQAYAAEERKRVSAIAAPKKERKKASSTKRAASAANLAKARAKAAENRLAKKLADEKERLAPKREAQDDADDEPPVESKEPVEQESESSEEELELVPVKKERKKAVAKPKPKKAAPVVEPVPKKERKPRVAKTKITLEKAGAAIEAKLKAQKPVATPAPPAVRMILQFWIVSHCVLHWCSALAVKIQRS